jgi:hypothetical protein
MSLDDIKVARLDKVSPMYIHIGRLLTWAVFENYIKAQIRLLFSTGKAMYVRIIFYKNRLGFVLCIFSQTLLYIRARHNFNNKNLNFAFSSKAGS